MPAAVIENPILNSPYAEPTRHFRFADDGITDNVVDHSKPRARGGTDHGNSLYPALKRANLSKGMRPAGAVRREFGLPRAPLSTRAEQELEGWKMLLVGACALIGLSWLVNRRQPPSTVLTAPEISPMGFRF
ncbi:MAG: hypothetical protein ACYDAG_03080 [Chloroflexota bacterium]